MNTIQLIEVNSELGAGTRGASLGAEALKIAAMDLGSEFFTKFPMVKIECYNGMLFKKSPYTYAKYIDGILKVYLNVSKEVQQAIYSNSFPLVLAGDHSSAGGTIAGLKQTYGNAKVGVIWVDAHGDLHSPYTSPTGNMHGMPLSSALGFDNIEKKLNNIDEVTQDYWNDLKFLGGSCPKISPKDIVLIGVRDTEAQEDFLIQKYGIKNITVKEYRKKGNTKIIEDVFRYLSHCEVIYVSFDVDSMDSSISVGTGTPVNNGFFENELMELLPTLIKNEKVVCLEVVEINPTLDSENKMAETVLPILEKTTENLEKRLQQTTTANH